MAGDPPRLHQAKIPRLTVGSSAIDGNVARQVAVRSQMAEFGRHDGSEVLGVTESLTFELIGLSDVRSDSAAVLRWPTKDVEEALRCDDLGDCWWETTLLPTEPVLVWESYLNSFSFLEESEAEGRPGLRPPQMGGIHAVLGYWSTSKHEPATVVMPTGTGKTDVMIALLAAARIEKLLVLVPTDALRTQLDLKFLELGVLQDFGVIHHSCLRPVVGTIRQGFSTVENAVAFARQCNVIITTPQALTASGPDQRNALLDEFDCLFVDEAHHVVASTWVEVRSRFVGKRVVQFTATPFREDKKSIGGKIIYDFPLREAQRLGYFTNINYRSVVDFADQDGAIAKAAVAQLEADLEGGHDHLVMARVKGIRRANELHQLYRAIAPAHSPVVLHSELSEVARARGVGAIRSRSSRIIVCVDMLGEGFDLPALKIAAIHDPHKSLGITLQFIGRFARSSGDSLGDATVVVARPTGQFDHQIRKLYSEDADWNILVSDLSESAIGNEESVREFDEGFSLNPLDLDIQGISPKMSTVVYRVSCADWEPDGVVEVYPPEKLVTYPYSVNEAEGVLWFVTQNIVPVPWGVSNPLEDIVYELFIVFYDRASQLLFINSSGNDGHHEELAKEVCGSEVQRIQGMDVYRAFANIGHLIPTNIGTRDIRDRNRSHTMHAGANVTEGLTAVDTQTKAQTNLFAKGFEEGLRASVGVSMKGRVWSFQEAYTIKHWVDWCRGLGRKLTDHSIDPELIMKNFIRPKPAETRPELVALAVEWPEHVITNVSENLRLVHQDIEVPLHDTALEIRSFNTTGSIQIRLRNDHWSIDYDIDIGRSGMRIRPVSDDVEIRGTRRYSSLAAYLNHHGLHILFEDEVVITEQCMLLRIDRQLEPYPRNSLIALNWDGVDLRKESQGRGRNQATVQARTLQWISQITNWDIVLDDDSAYETADIVALKVDDGTL